MDIQMAGIDYGRAAVEVRERFSLTRAAAGEALRKIREAPGAQGCVLLSTCNRVELWVSGNPAAGAAELLCRACELDPGSYGGYLAVRAGREAAEHLFALAAGMKSQVFGEDQIVTQVGGALTLARDCGCAGPVLEALFRSAVTAAKRVKTGVRLTAPDQSAAASTVEFLRERFGSLEGIPCLVIGNGEMGRLAAEAFVREGCPVRMTVRQYHHGEVRIPGGVEPVAYDARYDCLREARIVVSATASPHYTLRAERIGALARPVVFCDLAVPRDIEPAVGALEGAGLYDTDALCGGSARRVDEACAEQARAILREELEEFCVWDEFRPLVPLVREISGRTAEDLLGRMERAVRRTGLAAGEQERLLEQAGGAAEKAVGRLIFGLRESLAPALWKSCLEGLQRSAEREESR